MFSVMLTRVCSVCFSDSCMRIVSIRKYLNRLKIAGLEKEANLDNDSDVMYNALSLYRDLKKYPVALLLPLHYFSFFSFIVPSDVEESELQEWAESYIHTNIAEYDLYEYRYLYFLNISHYHCIIISLPKKQLARFVQLFDQSSLNAVYIGSGIETAGLGLADDDLFNQRIYLDGIVTDKSPIRLSYESGILCDVSDTSLSTSDKAIILTDDLEQVNQVCINGNNLSSDFVIPYGTGLNQLLSLGNDGNFLDRTQIQNVYCNLAKRQCLKTFIILTSIFILLFVLTQIGVSLFGDESMINAKDDMQKRIDQITEEISVLRHQQTQVDSIRGTFSRVSTDLEVIGRSIPIGMTLSELSITQTGEIREMIIRGDATSESEVLLLVRDLTSKRLFRDVSVKRIYSKNSSSIATDETRVLSFEINLFNRGINR